MPTPRPLRDRFRAAVFDFDGLMVDSEPLWVESERTLLARHGLELTEADIAATHGHSLAEMMGIYATRIPGADPLALGAEMMAIMRGAYAAGVPLRPGAVELVRTLADLMPVAIASNTDASLVRGVLIALDLGDAFTDVLSGTAVPRPKPAPDVYLAACEALGTPPAQVICFEDSPPGIRAAKAAGLWCVGVPDRDGVDLAAAGADLVVASLLEILPLV